VGFLLAALAALGVIVAQQTLTPEWIAGEGAEYAETPEIGWRSDGSLWIYDDRAPDRSPSFELMNPSTGTRRTIVDSARPLAALNGALSAADTLPRLPWPTLDDSGRRGLYVLGGDIFVLDVESGDVTRLTSTPARETSATFAPDGRKVAFVRDHDLYVVDVESKAETRLTRDGSDSVLNGILSWLY
jgi:hypothetical protein